MLVLLHEEAASLTEPRAIVVRVLAVEVLAVAAGVDHDHAELADVQVFLLRGVGFSSVEADVAIPVVLTEVVLLDDIRIHSS